MQGGYKCKLRFMFVNRNVAEGPERSSGTLGKLPCLLRIFVASSLSLFRLSRNIFQGKALRDYTTTNQR